MNYVFTGPESSGKSTLATEISKLTGRILVPEFAREYLTNLNRNYKKEDLLLIAQGLYKIQEEAKKNNDNSLCFDTDLLTIKIWSEVKFGTCDSWIMDRLYSNSNSFYILCKPDFPWEYDALRENPDDREELFELYQKELETLNLPYQISEGRLEERVNVLMTKRSLF